MSSWLIHTYIGLTTCFTLVIFLQPLTTSGDLGFNGRAEAQKIIIWSGDAPGHDAQDSPAGYYPTLDETIGALTAQGIMVFALNSSGQYSGLDALYHGRYQASEITAATGGLLFNNVGEGGWEIEDPIVEAIECLSFEKDDGIDEWDCRSLGEEITYTICWDNTGLDTLDDVFIIDDLPDGVTYPQGFPTFDPNDPLNPIPPDPAYDPNTHTYIWELGTILPDDAGCVEITVVVNEMAEPGMEVYNEARIISNTTLLAWDSTSTLICCWDIVDPNIIYVDEDATGNNNGVSWQDAYTDLQRAIARATNSVCQVGPYTIYVAQGTYDPNNAPDETFELPDYCKVYGGFKTGGCLFSERNPKHFETILSGQVAPQTRADTIVTMGDETLLDGFTVTKSLDYGIYGDGVDFNIENCVIKDNDQYGVRATDGNVIIKWCQVSSNNRDGIRHQGEGYTLTVENSQIIRNMQRGIYCFESTPQSKTV